MKETKDLGYGAAADELTLTADELGELIAAGRYLDLRSIADNINAVDLAQLISELSREHRAIFFRLLSKEHAAEVFVEMPAEICEELVNSFGDSELSGIISELYIDDTVDIIEEMPATVVKRILRSCDRESREQINRILKYPKDSAGSMMTTEYARLRADMTVDAALAHLRRVALDKETIYTCFVTDDMRRLIGIVTAKKLLISAPETEISEIMETNVIYASTYDDKEEVAAKFNKYGFISLPVVDRDDRLVGIVTIDDAMDVIKEETDEDFAKISAVIPTERPYLKASPLTLFKSRIPWLLLLMVSATLSSTILSRFEAALPAVLVLFVPMLMDTGGNSGSQASVTIIRGLSLGEVRPADAIKVVIKELAVGAACGVSLGAVAFIKVMLIDRLLMQNAAVTLTVAFAVAISLALTVVIAKLIGASLPIFAKLLGADPAVMASPLITTIVDALSLIAYFFIAANVFHL